MNKTRVKNTSSYLHGPSLHIQFSFVRKLVSRASRPRDPFFKLTFLSENKRMKSLMTQKTPKKWCFSERDVLLYDNTRLISRKVPRGRLALETSF